MVSAQSEHLQNCSIVFAYILNRCIHENFTCILAVTTLQGTTFHTLMNVKTLNSITMPDQGLYVMRLVFANGTYTAVTAMVKE